MFKKNKRSKGQFMIISAIAIGMIIMSLAAGISSITSQTFEPDATKYELNMIKNNIDNLDLDKRDDRERLNRTLKLLDSYTTETTYNETKGCVRVTLRRIGNEFDLGCLEGGVEQDDEENTGDTDIQEEVIVSLQSPSNNAIFKEGEDITHNFEVDSNTDGTAELYINDGLITAETFNEDKSISVTETDVSEGVYDWNVEAEASNGDDSDTSSTWSYEVKGDGCSDSNWGTEIDTFGYYGSNSDFRNKYDGDIFNYEVSSKEIAPCSVGSVTKVNDDSYESDAYIGGVSSRFNTPTGYTYSVYLMSEDPEAEIGMDLGIEDPSDPNGYSHVISLNYNYDSVDVLCSEGDSYEGKFEPVPLSTGKVYRLEVDYESTYIQARVYDTDNSDSIGSGETLITETPEFSTSECSVSGDKFGLYSYTDAKNVYWDYAAKKQN